MYLKGMVWRLLAVLLVLTGTAWSAPIVIKCYDGFVLSHRTVAESKRRAPPHL